MIRWCLNYCIHMNRVIDRVWFTSYLQSTIIDNNNIIKRRIIIWRFYSEKVYERISRRTLIMGLKYESKVRRRSVSISARDFRGVSRSDVDWGNVFRCREVNGFWFWGGLRKVLGHGEKREWMGTKGVCRQ